MSRSTEKRTEVEDIKNYHSIDRLSYSRLVQFDLNRMDYFMERVLKDEDYIQKKKDKAEDSYALKMGNLIDCLRTNEENYYNIYYESPEVKEPARLMKKFCELLKEEAKTNTDFKESLAAAYNNLKVWNGGTLSAGLPKFIENFQKEGQEYFDELVASDGKIVIAKVDYDRAKKAALKWNANKNFKDTGEVITKLVILFDYEGIDFKCEIDKINIDHKKKIVYLYDYKTVQDMESFVFNSFLKRRYYIQSSLYKFALQRWLQDKYPTYRVENMAFRCIDIYGNYDPLVYQTSDKMYTQGFEGFLVGKIWYKGIDQLIKELNFAVDNEMWGISLDNYNKGGIVMIPDFGEYVE